MQKEIQRLKEQPVSAAQEAENNIKIAQLEHEVLEVRQHIDTTLEIAEHEVKQARHPHNATPLALPAHLPTWTAIMLYSRLQAVLTAQASLREQNEHKYDSQGHSQVCALRHTSYSVLWNTMVSLSSADAVATIISMFA